MRTYAAERGRVWRAVLISALLLAAPVTASSTGWVFAVAKLPLSLPIYVAESKGFFKAENVSLKTRDCDIGRECLDRLLDGEAHLATTADSPMVFASLRGARFSVVATIAKYRHYSRIVTLRSLGIDTTTDLQGRRIGTFIGTTAHYFLELNLLAAGVDLASVKVVAIDPSDAAQALADRSIDAIAVIEPYASNAVLLLAPEAVEVPARTPVTDTWNVVVTNASDGPRDADLEKLCRALDRATAYIAEHPDESRRILQERLGLDGRTIDRAMKDMRFAIELRQSLIRGLEGQARWAIQEGHVDGKMPNYLEYVRPEPLATVRPGAVSVVR